MTNRARNRIAEVRSARMMTKQELADAVGAHWITISKLERGRMKLTTEWLDKLAAPLRVRPRDLLPDVDTPFRLTEPERVYPARKPPAPKMPPVWATIEGDTCEPLLHAGDEVELLPLTNLIGKQRKRADGRLAFAGTTNGSPFGFLRRAERPGRYDLFWFERLVVDNVKASDIYLVATITFHLERVIRPHPGQRELI